MFEMYSLKNYTEKNETNFNYNVSLRMSFGYWPR